MDEETDWRTFERIAADLLYRNGYPRIVPIEGPRDGGRDAQSRAHPGRGRHGELTFFQFSKEQTWRAKLRREMQKVSDGPHEPESFVFVTNQRVRGEEYDSLAEEARQSFQLDLTIFSREWFRLQLEVANRDLASLHLGITPQPRMDAGAPDFVRPSGSDVEEAWAAFEVSDFAGAIAGLKRYLDFNPDDYAAREALAWSQYRQHHYADALATINRALERRPQEAQGLMIRACILAEYGIATGNKASISEANAAFEEVAEQRESWLVRYNFGNTLGALGRHAEAVAQYNRALELDPDQPEVWKNLGSSLHDLGQHEEEMAAFDRALELNPELPQALISKGTSLLMDFDEPERGIIFLRKGMTVSGGEARRWPQSWYWLAMAEDRAGHPSKALDTISEGLRYQPGSHYLSHLRVRILAERWRESDRLRLAASQYLSEWLEKAPNEYFVARAISELRETDGDTLRAWEPLVKALEFFGFKGDNLSDVGFELATVRAALNHLPDYVAYRQSFPIESFLSLDDRPRLPWTPFVMSVEAFLAVPFGEAMAHFGDPENAADPQQLLKMLRTGIRKAVTRASPALADLVNPEAPQDEMVRSLSEVIGTPSVMALFEFISMASWLGSKLPFEGEAVRKAVESYPVNELQGSVAAESFLHVNDIVGVFTNDYGGDTA
ncbi:MAG TPA: tetratricopeptide repeat protein [Acidobacteriota bacterium]|nr:tetratricopeptide repeat protein [Acidobacteriota bacterium]